MPRAIFFSTPRMKTPDLMTKTRYASQEHRVGLMQELDHYHDCMKTLLNLHLDPANDPR